MFLLFKKNKKFFLQTKQSKLNFNKKEEEEEENLEMSIKMCLSYNMIY